MESSSPSKAQKKCFQSLYSQNPSVSAAQAIKEEKLVDLIQALASYEAVTIESGTAISKSEGLEFMLNCIKKPVFELTATLKDLCVRRKHLKLVNEASRPRDFLCSRSCPVIKCTVLFSYGRNVSR